MKNYILLILISLFLLSCGGRTPSPGTAQNIIKKHINHYGEKYPTSPFGHHKVAKVEILKIEELQRNLVFGEANVTLDNSEFFKIRMNFLRKQPLGWRAQGWEMLEPNPAASP
jgi:hypothetical protein